jgi:murein L,D-transpeptidase YafK
VTTRRKAALAVTVTLLLAAGALTTYRFWPATPLPPGARADRVLVLKGDRALVLLRDGKPLKRYTIALGRKPRGPKQRQGDSRTPEGVYRIDSRNRASRFHLALHISYPDAADRRRARQRGVPPGGDIMIHGMRNGLGWIGPLHRLIDWTNGCIAVTDREMDEIWRAVPVGTPVEIRPG